jgi:hypothetical protein
VKKRKIGTKERRNISAKTLDIFQYMTTFALELAVIIVITNDPV